MYCGGEGYDLTVWPVGGCPFGEGLGEGGGVEGGGGLFKFGHCGFGCG